MFEMLKSKKLQLITTLDNLNDILNKCHDKLFNSLEKDSIQKLNKNTQQILEPLKTPKFITYDGTKDELGNDAIQNNIEELEKALIIISQEFLDNLNIILSKYQSIWSKRDNWYFDEFMKIY